MNVEKIKHLPTGIQKEVKDKLKAYAKVYVTYFTSEYHVSNEVIVLNYSPIDYKFDGEYAVEEMYTEAERLQNYWELFHNSSKEDTEYAPVKTDEKLKNFDDYYQTKGMFTMWDDLSICGGKIVDSYPDDASWNGYDRFILKRINEKDKIIFESDDHDVFISFCEELAKTEGLVLGE
jgi:rRNA maturation protein Nop10